MTEWFAIVMGTSLFVLMIPVMYRICKGPTGFDRILGVNVIGTKTAVLLVIIGTLYERVEMFVDFALTYALKMYPLLGEAEIEAESLYAK
mgnify:CR=1 FL=1